MRKDPTEFRERFLRWKKGELVYENGLALPAYEDGKISDELYISIMEKVAADNYKQWGFENEDLALLYALNDNAYNYRGYYDKYPNGQGNAIDHWTDEFKTVWHPTFSDESIYSGKKSQYNPKGLKGGHWKYGSFGEKFIPAKWQRKPKYEDGKSPRKLEYHPEEDYYYGGKVFPGKELVVTGKNRKQKPYWVTAKTKQLQPSELMAPLSLVGLAVDKIPVAGPAFNEYVAPTLSLGNWVAGTGNPYKGAEIRANDERQLGAWLPLDFIGLKAPGKVKSTISHNIQPANIYRGFRRLGIPQTASKELLLAPDLAYKRFKNLDIFDKIRGIKYTDNVYHGSKNSFDINNAKTYSSVRHDTGLHLGSSPTPAYSRANGILGGVLYSGKLKLKEKPFEIRDLNTWDIDAIGGEAYNNPEFMLYLKTHGIDVDDLLKKGYELDHEYNFLNALELEEYLAKHGGMLSDKYLADLFKRHNINLKYKNEFETFSNTPEYSYAIYNPDNIVWNKSFKFSKKPEVLEKLKKLGIAKDYLLPDYHIDLSDLYTTLQSFPEFKLPLIRKN